MKSFAQNHHGSCGYDHITSGIGAAMIGWYGRIVLFFYFQDADTGLAMIIPGIRGQGDMARFHLTGGLTDPQKN